MANSMIQPIGDVDHKLDDAVLDSVQGAGTSSGWQNVDGHMLWVTQTIEPGHVSSDASTFRHDSQGNMFRWDNSVGHEVQVTRKAAR